MCSLWRSLVVGVHLTVQWLNNEALQFFNFTVDLSILARHGQETQGERLTYKEGRSYSGAAREQQQSAVVECGDWAGECDSGWKVGHLQHHSSQHQEQQEQQGKQ
jgi:hypothetical protein